MKGSIALEDANESAIVLEVGFERNNVGKGNRADRRKRIRSHKTSQARAIVGHGYEAALPDLKHANLLTPSEPLPSNGGRRRNSQLRRL